MIALYEATNGPAWANNMEWCKEADLKDWYGVKVDDQGRVVELVLVDNNLRGNDNIRGKVQS